MTSAFTNKNDYALYADLMRGLASDLLTTICSRSRDNGLLMSCVGHTAWVYNLIGTKAQHRVLWSVFVKVFF